MQVQSNALAALEAIDKEMAQEIMEAGCVTGDRINGLCDGVSGDWYVKFDTYHPAVKNGLPVTRVISRMVLQNILAKYAMRIGGEQVITPDVKIAGFLEDTKDNKDRVRWPPAVATFSQVCMCLFAPQCAPARMRAIAAASLRVPKKQNHSHEPVAACSADLHVMCGVLPRTESVAVHVVMWFSAHGCTALPSIACACATHLRCVCLWWHVLAYLLRESTYVLTAWPSLARPQKHPQ